MTGSLVRFARFDLVTLAATQPLRVLLPLLFTVVFTVTLPVPGLGVVIGATIASVSVSIPFQADERGRLDTLYGIAPVDRRAVVIGRYLSLSAFALVAIAVGTVATVVAAQYRHESLAWPLIAVMLLVAATCVSFGFAMQLPWFFALGFTRARPMMYVPVAIIAVAGFTAAQLGLLDGVTIAPRAIALPPLVAVGVLLGCVALLAGSAGVAARLYRRREL